MGDLRIGRSIDRVVSDVKEELGRARRCFPAFHSAHEGFAVLKEEVDELWDEVKARPGGERTKLMREEAIQVAAMALRFIVDCCEEEPC